MDYKITDRLQNIMRSENIANPQRLCYVLEEEFKPIVDNYMRLSKDFKVRFKQEGNRNVFFIELEAEKIKPFGYIP